LAPRDFGPVDRGASSTMEFQAPQPSQRPTHFLWLVPQAVQVKLVTGLAMTSV
jgi:hypothetical protein